ncbi:uroporphyrinogen-III synthase [Virgibacillus halophilus]|uniref:Uroporphyrinogen-III synthase n=1 Tax=Tigheibacillus halophilus TaxID=361280 RepID=A0ABU5CC23_9BACI|nr:uroporphyrinogen-III synthase [Virgibacillus halophilus]
MTLQQARILVTREKEQGKTFSEKIRAHGGLPIEVPLLQISCEASRENERRLRQLAAYEWIFFTSANGVKHFYELIELYHIPASSFGHVKIAVVGHKTEKSLRKYGGRRADFIPTIYDADHMAEQFLDRFKISGKALLVRGNLSRMILPKQLAKKKSGIRYVGSLRDHRC